MKKEWIRHENEHRWVWHCYCHEAEFKTQPEYMQHLKEEHPEEKWEDYPPELTASAGGGSAKPDRDCPSCPTKFSDMKMMWEHVRYHLERLALCALPDIGYNSDAELESER